PCSTSSDCKDPEAKTCDPNKKQCVGDKFKPIGAECSDNKECTIGSCYKGVCGSEKIGFACTGDQYKASTDLPPLIVQKLKNDGATEQDLNTCNTPKNDGASCLLNLMCKSGGCSTHDRNMAAKNITEIDYGKCGTPTAKPSGYACQDNSECRSGICNPIGQTEGMCR
ncbi:MAG: hypothetical protein AAB731_01650, partial [Patescibacteria group bacterium]